jgi:hypothetical protein
MEWGNAHRRRMVTRQWPRVTMPIADVAEG